MPTEAQKRAIKAYKDKQDFIQLTVLKDGTKARYKAHAERQGKSLNALMIELLEADIKKHTACKD